MKQPEIIKATYRIVTPMFIGDADQKASGITAAAVKGALRFWWRALNWGRVRKKCKNDVEALKTLHEEEAELFGSSAYDNKQRRKNGEYGIGQSKFILKVRLLDSRIKKWDVSESGLIYLLGQGLYKHNEGVLREEVILEGRLLVECIFHPCIVDRKKELEQALLALGVLGGLGCRSRRGFGSLAISDLISGKCKVPVPQTKEDLKSLLGEWKQSVQLISLPPFTAFSGKNRIDFSLFGKNALDLLNKAGEELQLYRSWGKERNGEHWVGQKKAEQIFKDSHDLMLNVSAGNKPDKIPDKAIFGLPQNYFFSSTSKNVEFSLGEPDRSRRASPLLMHVHQFPEGHAILIQALFPAIFLEDNATLKFTVIANNVKTNEFKLKYDHNMIDWNNIKKYMDRGNFRYKETV